MNRTIKMLYIILIFMISACNSESEGYEVVGKISGDEECLRRGKIYMHIAGKKGGIYDSAEFRNGSFKFKGKIESPERMLLYIKDLPHNIPLCLENSKYKIVASSASLREAEISGGESQELFNKLNLKSKKVMERFKLNELLPEYLSPKTDSLRKIEINSILKSANVEMGRFNDSLIMAAPASFFSLLNLYETVNVAELNLLSERLRFFEEKSLYTESWYYNSIKETIKKREALLAGKKAPDFTLMSLSGDMLNLNEITSKNRLSILIFWASWNKESIDLCRRFNSEYKRGNFKEVEIIAVSINDSASSWMEIVKKEKFNWINLIDNHKKDAMTLYNINLIPGVFLIDSNNNIIMNVFRFEDIEQYVISQFLK